MRFLPKYLTLIFVFAFFTNCTIQKRTVNKGYFVQWHFSKKSNTLNNSKLENDSIFVTQNRNNDSIATSVLNDISNFPNIKRNDKSQLISIIAKKEVHFNTFIENKIENNSHSRAFSSPITKLVAKNKKSSAKYYNKAKGKKAGKYFFISAVSFLVMLLAFWLAMFSNFNGPEWFYDVFLVAILFISLISFLFFGILAIIKLISALIKPKEKKTR